jgi:hypothetical protein
MAERVASPIPPHITAEDIRLIANLAAPVLMAKGLRAAAEGVPGEGAREYLIEMAQRLEAEISPWLGL